MATPRRRSNASISPRVSARLYKRQKGDDGTVQENDLSATELFGNDSWSIVTELFRSAPPGIWWRLMPEKNATDDISYATSIDWEDIYTLLLDANIIATRNVLGVERVSFIKGALDKLASKLQPILRLQVCRFRPSGSERLRSNYFCIGAAKYRLKDLARAKAVGLCLKTAAINETFRSKCRDAAQSIRERALEQAQEQLAAQVAEQATEQESEEPSEQAAEHPREQENLLLQDITAVADEPQPQREAYVDVLDWDNEQTQNAIESALRLNFESVPRYVRGSSDKEITIHLRKQFTTEERALAILLANEWGFQDITNHSVEKQRIAKAACKQMSFDCGFKTPIQGTQLNSWLKNFREAFIAGEPMRVLEKRRPKGSEKLLAIVEKTHPGYVRELFLYAKQNCGPKPTFAKLANLMKARSADPQEERLTLAKLDRKQVSNWYKANKDAETDVGIKLPSMAPEETDDDTSRDEYDL